MLNELIKDNTLFIVPIQVKKNILYYLNNISDLINIKIMTLQEFYNNYFFSYDKEAIVYLSTHYNMKPSISKVYLDNLIYVEDKEYNNTFLDKLVTIKKELNENNLLIKNNSFIKIIERNSLVVNYDLSSFDKKIFENISKSTTVTYIEPTIPINHMINKITFTSISEEVTYVIEDIIKHYLNGTRLNNIFITNLSDDYKNILKRTCDLFDIPINLGESTNLYGTNLCNKFLKLIDNENNWEDIISKFKPSQELNELINIINSYAFYDGPIKNLKPFIKEDIKSKSIKKPMYKEAINVVNLDYNFSDTDYVYLLGFNSTTLPITYSDEDFISDANKNILGLDNTEKKNVLSRKNSLNNILEINNLLITYSKIGPNGEMFISNLSDGLLLIEIDKEEHNIIYSTVAKKVELAKLLDTYTKYGDIKNNLIDLYSHFGINAYKSYDNKFTGINKENLKDYLHNNLTLSYSSMDNYYKCAFRYYLNNILKVNIYESTFAINVGTIFHAILEQAFIPNFDFEKLWEKETKNYEFNTMEQFLLSKLKNELSFIIKTINKQSTVSSFDKILCEKEIYISRESTINVTFKGFVDKILYKEEMGNTYVAVIDYKTGHPSTNLDNINYGLEMQLPVYLYLIKNSNLFTNVKFTGFYLQKILNSEINIVKGKTYQEQKEANLKLVGYTNSRETTASYIDENYSDSSVVKGLKQKADGSFYATSKVITDEEIDSLIKIVDEKIKYCYKSILEGDFTINPKNVSGVNMGCKYCPFNDICYKTDADIVYLKESGDDNAKMD